jgi:hypothetical protein
MADMLQECNFHQVLTSHIVVSSVKASLSCRAHGNNFYGYGGQLQTVWYLKITKLRYIYSNPFRFPISSLGLPNIPSQEN